MINETTNITMITMNNTSAIYQATTILAKGFVGLLEEYHWLVLLLAFFGLFAVISAIGSKLVGGLKYLFIVFVALPAIIIVGLLNKKERAKRKAELGEIRAHLKIHPEKWKVILFYALLWCFVFFMIGVIIWTFKKI